MEGVFRCAWENGTEQGRPAIAELETIAGAIDTATTYLADAGATHDQLTTVRSALFAAVDDANAETWETAYSIKVAEDTTLWQLVHRAGGYPVIAREAGAPWPLVPTGEQLLTALRSLQPVG